MPESLDSLSSTSSKYSSRKFRSERSRSRTPARKAQINHLNSYSPYSGGNPGAKFAKERIDTVNKFQAIYNFENKVCDCDNSNLVSSLPLTIPQARRAGLIDDIKNSETKLKIISLFQENDNYINLTEIPMYYFSRYNRALEYFGKFKYAIVNELPGILTQLSVNSVIIVRLAEPFQLPNTNVLPIEFIKTNNKDTDHEDASRDQDDIEQICQRRDKVLTWLKGENQKDTEMHENIIELENLVEKRLKSCKGGDENDTEFEMLRKKLITELFFTP